MTFSLLLGFLLSGSPANAWPGFRGVGDSVSLATNVPAEWSDEQGIAWQATLDGFGQSSPVIIDNRVFVTSVRGELKDTLVVQCFQLTDGRREWTRELKGTQQIADSNYVSKSAPTPIVDEKYVYALFESGDLCALDHAGQVVWERSLVKEFGTIEGAHGLGSSLARSGDHVIVLIDHAGPSYLMACERATGKTIWKVDRGTGVSWSSPILVEEKGKSQVVTSAHDAVESFDAKTGERLWKLGGVQGNNVPSPTSTGSLLLIGSDKPGSSLAMRGDGAGDLDRSQIVWSADKRVTTSFGSPLAYEGHGYFVNKSGVCFCVDLATGEPVWMERLPSSCWASPTGAAGRVYFFGKSGETRVVAAGPEYKVIADNVVTLTDKEDRIYGVAVVEGRIVMRLTRKLIALGKPVSR